MKLIIGNRNYSSWSLRAWLYMTESGLDFEVTRLRLFEEDWRDAIGRYSPAGRVPVLMDGDVTIWDSLAIIEYLMESYAGTVRWPGDRRARAHGRSVVAEMHSGFMAVRDELPQNLRSRVRLPREELSSDCRQQIDRIEGMWRDCYRRYGGPWLFGEFTVADVFYAPVALRFVSYSIELAPEAQQFVQQVEALGSIARWKSAAMEEPEHLDFIDELKPAAETPLVLG